MAGVIHSPESDIQAIAANLRDRYKSGFPVLKEIIQNSDDAGASELTMGWCEGMPGAEHPLLGDPAIFFINNKGLTPGDVRGIMSIALGDKADNKSAVGKFGLGMKSLFHFGEVFFFMADDWRECKEKAEVFNPWSHRRKQWDAFSDEDKERLEDYLVRPINQLSGKSRFIIWVPLRSESIMASRGDSPAVIVQSHDYRMKIPEFFADPELGSKVSRVFPMLKAIEKVRLCAYVKRDFIELFSVELPKKSDFSRMAFGAKPSGGENDLATHGDWSGRVSLISQESASDIDYFASELYLNKTPFTELKENKHWPSNFGRGDDQVERLIPDKAEPHSAAVLMRQPSTLKAAYLTVQWAVFLPLGEQDISQTAQSLRVPISGEYSYDLLLHGYFFIDAGRVGIHGQREIGSTSKIAECLDSEETLTLEWNRQLANQGTLNCIIPALSGLVEKYRLSQKEVISITKGLLDFLCHPSRDHKLLTWATVNVQWVYKISPVDRGWVSLTAQDRVRLLPAPVTLSPSSEDYDRVWETFPAFKNGQFQDVVFAESGQPNLVVEASVWSVEEVLSALDIDTGKVFSSRRNLGYINDYLEYVFSENTVLQQQIQTTLISIARKALTVLSLEDLSKRRKWIQKFFGYIFPGKRVSLKVDKEDQEIWNSLCKCSTEEFITPLFLDNVERPAAGRLGFLSAKAILDLVGSNATSSFNVFSTIERVVLQILTGLGDKDRSEIYKSCSQLPLFPARGVPETKETLVSRDQLYNTQQKGLLFTYSGPGNIGLGAELFAALDNAEVYFVKEQISKQLFDGRLGKCDDEGVFRALTKEPTLSGPEHRQSLLQRLSGAQLDSIEELKAMKFLLHGRKGLDDSITLWLSGGATGVWERLTAQIQQSDTACQLLIPTLLGQLINLKMVELLNISKIQPSSIVENHSTLLAGLDYDSIVKNKDEAEEILAEIPQKELWCQLPLHTTRDGKRVCIDELSVLDGVGRLPKELQSSVTYIATANSLTVQQQQERYIGYLDDVKAIRIALSQPEPNHHAVFILSKLQRISAKLDERTLQLLKSRPWLQTEGRPFSPSLAIDLQSTEAPEIAKLCGKSEAGFLLENLTAVYQGYLDVIRTLVPAREEFLPLIIKQAAGIPEYALGECQSLPDEAIEQAGRHLEAFSDLPGWALLAECSVLLSVNAIALEHCNIDRLLVYPVWEEGFVKAHQYLSDNKFSAGSVAALRACLLRSICSFPDPERHLKNMRFLAKDGQYRAADKLAHDVVGLDAGYLLHEVEWELLEPILEKYRTAIEVQPASGATTQYSSENTAEILRRYFYGWRHYIAEASIGPVLALMSGSQPIAELADSLLGARSVSGVLCNISRRWQIKDGYRKSDFFPKMSLEEVVSKMQFRVVLFQGREVKVKSLFGLEFNAKVSKKPDSIFLWENTRHRHMYDVTLQLVPVDLKSLSESEILDILKNSCEILLDKIYRQAIRLDDLWDDLNHSEQLDIAVARAIIMDDIVHHLKELRVTRPSIGKLVYEYKQDHQRVIEAGLNRQKYQSRRKEIVESIRLEIESNSELQSELLEAKCRKLKDYQYQDSSVPFELFQNADDALQERLEIEGDGAHLPEVQRRFIVEQKQQGLSFYHWGRELNQYRTIDGRLDGRARGFDADLEKMLTLNVSDKGKETTGKFGLGFKSCLLVSDKPEIHSGRLAIAVTGGMLPEVSANAEQLSRQVKQHSLDGRSPTLIHLPLKDSADVTHVLGDFKRATGLLPVFSKQISTIVVNGEEYIWDSKRCKKIHGLEFGYADFPLQDGRLRKQRIAHYRGKRGQFVFQLSGRGLISLADRNLPKFWVLNPLTESIPLGFIVEADFQVDVGRSQLARKSPENVQLMKLLGVELATFFHKLNDWSQADWSGFIKDWDFEEQTTPEDFWKSVWRVLTDGWPSRVTGYEGTGEQDVGAHLVNELFMAEGALLSFYRRNPVMPTELPEVTPKLISIATVQYYADPLVSRLITHLARLPNVAVMLINAELVSENPGSFLKRICSQDRFDLSEMSLDRIVTALTPDNQVSPDLANSLAGVFNADFEKLLVEQRASQEQVNRFKRFLGELYFLSENQVWTQSSKLLLKGTGDEEEHLKSDFAPEKARLSSRYSPNARQFFSFCRDRLRVDKHELFEWVKRRAVADSGALQKAICAYVVHGEQGENLAKLMSENRYEMLWMSKIDAAVLQEWRWNKHDIDELLNFRWATKLERDRRVDQQLKDNWQAQHSTGEILTKIHDWWRQERATLLPDYNMRLYPSGHFPWELIKEGDVDNLATRKAWLQLLYLGSCHTLGRSREEQHRSALSWFEQKGWWEVFATSGPVEPQQWFEVMDQYLDQAITNDQYRNWLQILPLYRFSRGLDDYLDLFYGAERFLDDLDDILRPGSSENLAGTGISPPELRATLGIGINFILRELVRNNVMEASKLAHYCFVPSRVVRSILGKLDCPVTSDMAEPKESEKIYRFIADELGEELASFNNDFDIPFRILCEDRHRLVREAIFGIGILDIDL
ncbi:MAG: hypothetical protein GYB33_09645 [Gammaproteobacteria bacterium]|nr:hypothetical protein [Gammaproteobacteria bacterium]